jgi:glycosyltransferase involved in cell wall biosynthesis
MKLSVVIPALNEEAALPLVLRALWSVLPTLPAIEWWEILVADNGSTDRTAAVARAGGARVVTAPQKGYGAACWAALQALSEETDTVLFIDGDHSDFPEDLPLLMRPVAEGRADLAIGVRVPVGRGALTLPQRFGNALACSLVRLLYGYRYEDLGPCRVVRRAALDRLQMKDRAFGWTMEMQVKAVRRGLRIAQVPVRYRARLGVSKISGTIGGSLRAGSAILGALIKHR